MKLNNGVEIPQIGFGVYQIPAAITKECVLSALKIGYRHIDTAFMYRNEKEVGEAIRECGIPREEIFVTTKIVHAKSYEEACEMIERALTTLDIGYIDLMLIHWPSNDYVGTYKAMEKYYRLGKLRALGISNFYGDQLNDILANAEIPPTINQIEANVFYNQNHMKKILDENNIILEAYTPLAQGRKGFFENEILLKVGEKYHKSVAQVALRYLVQKGYVVIPKTTNPNRMKENFEIFDFTLSEEDIILIAELNEEKSVFAN